jgi:hypothetical protein
MNSLEQAYKDRELWRSQHVHKPVSKQRQKELLKLFPRDQYFPIDGGLTEEEDRFLLIDRVLHSKWAESMSIFEFLGVK